MLPVGQLGVLYSYIYHTSICSSQLLYELNYDMVTTMYNYVAAAAFKLLSFQKRRFDDMCWLAWPLAGLELLVP